MSNITDFKPQAHLKAAAQLDVFISWAQATLPKGVLSKRVHAGIRWDMNSWHQYGLKACTFSAHGSPRSVRSEYRKNMQPAFMDFAKAVIVYHGIFRNKKAVHGLLPSLRNLEVALRELTGTGDITLVSTAVCNRACEHLQAYYSNKNTAYTHAKYLSQVVSLMREKGLLVKPFQWAVPLRGKSLGTLREQRINRDKKLPSSESIRALGELFNNELTSPLDIITVSACALLLSQPSRIGELADVERNCVMFKDDAEGGQRMFLRWYAEKGYGATTKPVVGGMEPAVERVIKILDPITDEARAYAAWLEKHPDEFPPHESVPQKSQDDPLSYDEACAALKTMVHSNHSARGTFKKDWVNAMAKRVALSPKAQALLDEIQQGWDSSAGKRVYIDGRLHYYEYNDRTIITLRKLNILVREKYLPKDFPYTTAAEDGKKRVKYCDALFTVRTGSLPDETRNKNSHLMSRDFGVEIAANHNRMTSQLGGCSRRQSIFQRHGYGSLQVNTHAFRHELNTEMHRAGLSQLLIDAFSGRTSRGSVYNHVTVEERTQAVALVHPKTKPSNAEKCLDKIRTNQPLKFSDLTELEEGDQDLVIHKTYLGLCFHRFESEPCPKMGACLTCGMLACVKGDDVKLANLKGERAYLKERYEKAVAAEAKMTFGASEWRQKTGMDLFKCDALVKLLESPELQNGDIVWNGDNGWNLTNNAAVMAGIIDVKTIEAPKQEALPSLDELAAILNDIEV